MRVQPIDPGEDVANARNDPRRALFAAATLHCDYREIAIRIRNLSSTGMLIEGPDFPAAGTVVRVQRGAMAVSGTVAWSDSERAGLTLDAPVSLEDWLGRPAMRDAQIVPLAQPIARALTSSPREEVERLVTMMRDLGAMLDPPTRIRLNDIRDRLTTVAHRL